MAYNLETREGFIFFKKYIVETVFIRLMLKTKSAQCS